MRKFFVLVGLLAALAIPATAYAATLHAPHQNVFTCSAGGTWHFVQNQTGGSQVDNTLTAVFFPVASLPTGLPIGTAWVLTHVTSASQSVNAAVCGVTR